MYDLSELPPTPGVAEVAWQHLQRRTTLGVHATETLDTFVRHEEPDELIARLFGIAGETTQCENLRVAALSHLRRLGASDAVRQLGDCIKELPAVTWAFHIGLLEASAEMNLPRLPLDWLKEVDNLHLQQAIASFCAG